jgi:hypothetical protein
LQKKQRDAVGLVTFADTVELQTPVRSTSTTATPAAHAAQLLEQPASAGPAPAWRVSSLSSPSKSLNARWWCCFPRAAPQNRTIMLAALQHCATNHEVLLFHVMDRATEADFSFRTALPVRGPRNRPDHELQPARYASSTRPPTP